MTLNWIPDNLKTCLKEPPVVEFSEWTSWKDRTEIPNKNFPGVYLLARFDVDQPPRGPASHMDPHIIYIGVTGTRSNTALSSRWSAFHRTAFKDKGGHAGGRTYLKNELPQTIEGLYVAAMAQMQPLNLRPREGDTNNVMVSLSEKCMDMLMQIDLSDPMNRSWRLYVERRCLFEFSIFNGGKLPECNKQ